MQEEIECSWAIAFIMFIPDPEELKELLEKIKQKATDAVIVVEGQKDKAALIAAGINGDFFLICRQRSSLQGSAEKISKKYKRALLFLDADAKGKQLTRQIKSELQRLGTTVNDGLEKKLLALTKCSCVEGVKI